MFKVEVDVIGTIHGHYVMNSHDEDFLQFMPKYFTGIYGEVITKDQLTVYKIDEDKMPLLEGKLKNQNNSLDCDSELGKIKVCRHDDAKFLVDEYVPIDIFMGQKSQRESIFNNSSSPQTVSEPTTVQHDFGNGLEDAKQIPAGHELSAPYSTLELELVGTALNQWSYDESGKFLGNN